jgi:hypothetical protein
MSRATADVDAVRMFVGFALIRGAYYLILMVAIANKEPFQLTVEGGTHLELQVGKPPIINGEESKPMKVACGAAIMGMFGPQLKDLADEMIILDSDITGLFSESHVGRLMGFKETGIKPPGRFSTPGRYFGTVGNGWGGTPILNPLQALASIDKEKIWPGMKILILEVTGREAVLLEADEEKVFHVVELPKEAIEMRDLIASNREPSLTSGMYIGGAGGSARSGVTRNPIKLTQAVHHGFDKNVADRMPKVKQEEGFSPPDQEAEIHDRVDQSSGEDP